MVDLFENKEKLFSGPYFIPLEEEEGSRNQILYTYSHGQKGWDGKSNSFSAVYVSYFLVMTVQATEEEVIFFFSSEK